MNLSIRKTIKAFRRTLLIQFVALAAFAFSISDASAQVLLRDAEIEEWLDDYSRPLLEVAGINPDSIEILLIGDPTFNAFAGGRIMGFHTGLLTLSATPNEIEAVIAHEVAHIAGGHTARSDEASSAASRSFILGLVLGAGAIAAGAPEAGLGLLGLGQTIGIANILKYSRGQEASADQASLTYLERLGKSGRGAMDVWAKRRASQILRDGQPINPYLQTHPLATEREDALRQRVEASPYKDVADTEEDLHRLRMIQAKIYGFLEEPKFALRRYPESDTSEPAKYARAVAHYRGAEIDKGLSEIDSLIEKHPDNPYFHELKGQMLFEFGRVNDAVAPHREAVRLDPTEALLRINLGRALLGNEDPEKAKDAISEFRSALLIEPDNSFAWFELSRAYGLRGEIPMAHLATAESKYHSGRTGEAAQFAQRAVKGLTPGTPEHRQAIDIIESARNLAEKGGRRR